MEGHREHGEGEAGILPVPSESLCALWFNVGFRAEPGTVTPFQFTGPRPPRAPWVRALRLFWLGLARPAWSSIDELTAQRRLDFADKLRASQRPANHGAAADLRYAPLVLSFLQ